MINDITETKLEIFNKIIANFIYKCMLFINAVHKKKYYSFFLFFFVFLDLWFLFLSFLICEKINLICKRGNLECKACKYIKI